jgi:hypothetical protein
MPAEYALDDNWAVDNKQAVPQRPWQHRLLHTVGEVLLSFLFAGGVFLVSVKLLCLNNRSCNGFGGVAFFVVGFLVAIVIWGWFLTLIQKLRDRLPARKKLDIATGVVTVILWVAFFAWGASVP